MENESQNPQESIISNNSVPDESHTAEASTATDSAPTEAEIVASFTEPEKKSKKPFIIAMVVLAVLLVGGGVAAWFLRPKPAPTTPVVQNDQEALSYVPESLEKLSLKDNNLSDFDLTFLKLDNNPQNKIYSPLSIKYALAMLKDGSSGNSAAQIEALIGDYHPKAYLNSEHRSLANAMFIRNDFRDMVLDSYTESLKTNYNAAVILDPFTSPDPVNAWISSQTLGIIQNMFDDQTVNTGLDYLLINALAIDMHWQNQFQCSYTQIVPCKTYSVRFAHEKYYDSVGLIGSTNDFDKITFNGKDGVSAAEIGVSANRYDIIKELGEDYIRATVRATYEEYAKELDGFYQSCMYRHQNDGNRDMCQQPKDADSFLEEYMEELSKNYGVLKESTDFYFSDNVNERVFAKDLQEYDGSILQYVAIMPKTGNLATYVANLDAEKAKNLIDGLKDASDINIYKDGVVTKVTAHIPFFNFDHKIELTEALQELGVTDVFSAQDADLSKMLKVNLATESRPYIAAATHKADIEFSNDGIKAAAVTALDGMGAGGDWDYEWDVPVEEIDLTFDKPFLFLIRDKATGEIWFAGTVYEP